MNQEPRTRKRSVTSLSLEWIAKKMRKANSIKNRLNEGTYQVQPDQVAKTILNQDSQQ